MKVKILGAALVLFAAPALAEMPDYNVKAHCTRIASFGGGPSQIYLQAG